MTEKKNEATESKVATVFGVEVAVDEKLAEDWEFMEALVGLNNTGAEGTEKASAAVLLAKTIFGDKYEDVKRAIKAENGRIKTSVVIDAINKVMEEAGLKN